MKTIKTIEETLKAYSDGELESIHDKFAELVPESLAIIGDECYKNPLHDALADLWDIIIGEKVTRERTKPVGYFQKFDND